jgi:large subunit ribosomal protein L2
MAIKKLKPTNPASRFQEYAQRLEVTTDKPHKALVEGKKRISGRNNKGRQTIWFRGGGHKRRYRIIDFHREKDGVPATVASVEYDPNRSAHIALLHYRDGEKRYILAPVGLTVGSQVMSGEGVDIQPGNTLALRNIPLGTLVHNIELKIGAGGQLVRGAGTSAQLMAKEGDYATLKMPSGEMRLIHQRCRATIGQIGNTDHENVRYGKAGRSRWFGIRPHVRGIAMNPIDHPHGGGEGRSKGNHPQSPWGVLAKGHKTRRNPRTDKYIVQKRKK